MFNTIGAAASRGCLEEERKGEGGKGRERWGRGLGTGRGGGSCFYVNEHNDTYLYAIQTQYICIRLLTCACMLQLPPTSYSVYVSYVCVLHNPSGNNSSQSFLGTDRGPNQPPTSHLTLPPHEQETSKVVVTLPYIRYLSESIRRILTPLGICTCFRPHQTLRRTLVHLKDRVEPDHRAGVVYKIPCRSCTKVYIGQTGCTLEHRLKVHRRALVSGDVNLSAVAQHVIDEGHDIH